MARFSNLNAWLAWQETCHPQEIDLGLNRIRQVAERLDLLQTPATVITVAGTNGKGSCIATLEKLLLAQGYSTGAYTSPHLLRYNERIRLGATEAKDVDICRAFAAIDEARGEISLSYFEFGTLAALWLFRDAALDYWLLEVGLGGRLDATNILDADVAVVTSIALDHQQWLGNDRESIGREKAGIFREGQWSVCADKQAPNSVSNWANEIKSRLLLARADFDFDVEGDYWSVRLAGRPPLRLPIPDLPHPSVAAALQVLDLIQRLPDAAQLAELLEGLSLAGRFQRTVCGGRKVYLDVAHNPAAAEHLALRLEREQARSLEAVVAMMADKDIKSCLQSLLPFVERWWLPPLSDMPRAAAPERLYALLTELGVAPERISIAASVADVLERLCHTEAEAGSDEAVTDVQTQSPAVLVTGSFFTVSAAMHAIGSNA